MTKEEKETPAEFRYSIWDTRTTDNQPNINVTSAVQPIKDTDEKTVPDTL